MKGTKGAALRVSGDGAVALNGAGDPSGITVFADPKNTAGIASDVRNNVKPNFSVQLLLNSVRTIILNRECGQ